MSVDFHATVYENCDISLTLRQWNPGVISDVWWTVTTSSEEDQVKFCDIRISHIGDNYVCKQESRHMRLMQTTYDSPESDYGERTPVNSTRATSMTVHLMRYANAGTLWTRRPAPGLGPRSNMRRSEKKSFIEN